MIINSIEWREQNLRNSVISEKNSFEQLLYIKKQIEYLNTLAYHNIVAKFQLDMAKKEGKKVFTLFSSASILIPFVNWWDNGFLSLHYTCF